MNRLSAALRLAALVLALLSTVAVLAGCGSNASLKPAEPVAATNAPAKTGSDNSSKIADKIAAGVKPSSPASGAPSAGGNASSNAAPATSNAQPAASNAAPAASNAAPAASSTDMHSQMGQGASNNNNNSTQVSGQAGAPAQQGTGNVALVANVTYTLKTGLADGRMAFIGVGGEIDGKVNPELKAKPGDTVQITLVNGDGVDHDLQIPDLGVKTDHVMAKNASSALVFKADKQGAVAYFCSVPGHRQAGMEGRVVIGDQAAQAPQIQGADISRDPSDLPGPLGNRGPQNVRVDLETIEVEGQLADGVTYTFWTFNGKVPGPFIRVMEGDTVEVHLKNRAGSTMTHSVDFHAVTGPGGGAAVTQTPPGQEMAFTFKAINPGLYVYHCATPMVAHHITNGMYGLILVEPKGGLPKVDREFYVMQGELYPHGALKQRGHQEFDVEKLLAEQPEYFIYNGSTDALTKKYPLKANVGETVRIFYGVGGPNFTSSFHVIGEIFDRVYDQASLTSAPLTNVQTTTVPAGGATMVEFKLDVPGRFILVDHALSRMERGLAGFLQVEGQPNDAIFKADPNNAQTGSGGH